MPTPRGGLGPKERCGQAGNDSHSFTQDWTPFTATQSQTEVDCAPIDTHATRPLSHTLRARSIRRSCILSSADDLPPSPARSGTFHQSCPVFPSLPRPTPCCKVCVHKALVLSLSAHAPRSSCSNATTSYLESSRCNANVSKDPKQAGEDQKP